MPVFACCEIFWQYAWMECGGFVELYDCRVCYEWERWRGYQDALASVDDEDEDEWFYFLDGASDLWKNHGLWLG